MGRAVGRPGDYGRTRPGGLGGGGRVDAGVTVTAQNPGTAGDSDLRLTLTAHSAASTVPNPSCRPEDRNIECWGDLVLRVPEMGGLTLKGLEVHRIAVGATTCGGACGGMTAALTPNGSYPVEAQVNGLSTITSPGTARCQPEGTTAAAPIPCPVGTRVQVKITLIDNGPGQYVDTASVQINQFMPGPTKPLLWETGVPQTIQRVQIHVDNG